MRTQWDSKDPDEREQFGVDWRTRLGVGDTITASTWSLVTPAGITVSDEEFDAHFSTAIIAGGTDGLIASIQISVDTASGDHLEITKRLPIVSSAGEPLTGFTVPTPANFVLTMPKFADVDASVIADALAQGAAKVTTDWKQADFAPAIRLFAAHQLTLDGHGKGTEAQLAAEGLTDFQQIRSGTLHLQRFDRASGLGSDLESTSFGRRFARLMRLNFAGPRIVFSGRDGRRIAPGAMDC